VFGVMNTLFAAIRQHSADIGLLRILGFARWQVLVSFLLEPLMGGERSSGCSPFTRPFRI
jgi:ABC-type antimicrobial peptide transport system permease subunit